MILSELLGVQVLDADGGKAGAVVDVRVALDGPPGQLLATPRIIGLLVSPHSRASMWGYERIGATGPAPIAAFIRWRHRGLFLVDWADVARVDADRVMLRPGAERRNPRLAPQPATAPSRERR